MSTTVLPAAIEFNQTKFAALILYIAHRCRNDKRFGTMKLCKILYYCDFEAYRRFSKPITGATYTKMGNGPVPLDVYKTRRMLIRDDKANVEPVAVGSYYEDRLIPVDDHIELGDDFSDDEREIIDETIDRLSPMNGTEASALSHGEFGWQAVEFDEPIPYAAALIARQDDARYVKWLAEQAT